MAWSKRDWEKHIRKLSTSDECIFWSKHAKQQMRSRSITIPSAMDVIRKGVIHLEPEVDMKKGNIVCRMERFVSGRSLAICVALECEGASECLVVTAIVIGS
ncbi:DUF4258 domain-containing protein [Caballeronia telluris]|uniref:DUF4258 domain-containing protein n=1 Tax=Caballeronia telluris TaxID=326475 RepID=UPI000F74A179